MLIVMTQQGRVILPGSSIEEYDHYATYMNGEIEKAGGGLGVEEHTRLTHEYNAKYGREMETLAELGVDA